MLRQHPFDRCPFDKGHYSIPTQAMHYNNGNPLNHYQQYLHQDSSSTPHPPQKKRNANFLSNLPPKMMYSIKVWFFPNTKNRGFPTKKRTTPDFPDCETPRQKIRSIQRHSEAGSWNTIQLHLRLKRGGTRMLKQRMGNGCWFGMRGGKKQTNWGVVKLG